MIPGTVVGQVTGTGALINVVLGFKPDHITLVNRTTGDQMIKFRAGAGSIKRLLAGTGSLVTGAAGIADYSGPTGDGFTIPADANVNVNTNIIDYVAIRTGPGGH